MELILWCHADAEEGALDLSRQLTENGLKQAEKMAAWLKAEISRDVRVLSSPALRAQQTAMALCDDFEIVPALEPGTSPNQLLAAADWPYASGTVIVVGHQPTLGETARLILSEIPSGLYFKTCAVVWFSYRLSEDIASVNLRTVMYPEML